MMELADAFQRILLLLTQEWYVFFVIMLEQGLTNLALKWIFITNIHNSAGST